MEDFYRRLIKPIRDTSLNEIINSAKSSDYSPYDKEFSWAERIIPIRSLVKNTIRYTNNWISGLDKFPHVYVMNGNTHSLDVLFNRLGKVAFKKDDYMYYSGWHKSVNRECIELEEPRYVDDIVFTWPGYKNGDRTELDFARSCNAKRMHLDCAYLGLVKPDNIDVSDFETVSLSFSKMFSVPFNRIGLLFSKTEIPELTLLNKLGYVNLAGVKLINHIMSHLPLEYWWETYGEKIDEICKTNNLTSANSILFAYSEGVRVGLAPYWNTNQD